MRRSVLAALALIPLLAACDAGARVETRTFPLQHMESYEASSLIDPYVYGDREGSPGMWSVTEGAITVRETPDNLERIGRVLEQYDVERPDVRLHFQLIQADGFTEQDARIMAVEEQLHSLFQFEGYRLVGEGFVAATDGSEVEQGLGPDHAVQARIMQGSGAVIRLENVHLYSYAGEDRLSTTVNIRPGQTLVLGSASRAGEDVTLLLTVRAEEVVG